MERKLNDDEKKFLLGVARRTIDEYLKKGEMPRLKATDTPGRELLEDGACFVTLRLGGELRGCIGSLEAHRPLVLDVLSNSVASAFEDPRFVPLTRAELQKVKISISVLTKPKPLPVKDADDLLAKLEAGKHGLIIHKGYAGATFLPAVWEELPEKEEFLANLCMKAGLRPDEWKNAAGMKFEVYEAEEFGEE